MTMTFWKRTLEIFKAEPVRLKLRGRGELIGDIGLIGDTAFRLKKADGSAELIQFDEILVCEPAVGKL